MNLSGICNVSKEPPINFAKTIDGRDIAKGKLFWPGVGKAFSDVKFIAYDEMAAFFESNHEKKINIKKSSLKMVEFEDKKTFKIIKYFQLTVFDAEIADQVAPIRHFQETDY